MKKTFLPIALSIVALGALSLPSLLAEDAEPLKVGEFVFTISDPWVKLDTSSPMRVAELAYGSDEGAPQAVFYHFPGQGGSTEANIQRWIGQFEGEPTVEREPLEFDGKKVAILVVKGTYLDGPPFGGEKTPRPNYTLLGAVLESEGGAVFIKFVGPTEKLEAAKEHFKTLASSPFKKAD